MAIDALGSGSNASIIQLFKQRRAAMQDLESAVKSGDIKTAQSSLATLKQADTGDQSGAAGSGNNPYRSAMKSDLSVLMQAVDKGDLGAAQAALQTLDKDREAAAPPAAPPSLADALGGSDSTFLTDLKSLIGAAQSGDTGSVQRAMTALQSDLQSLLTSGGDNTGAAASDAQTGQPSFVDDIKSLLDAAKSSDTKGMQDAAKKIAADIQNAVAQAQGGPQQAGGHHHHHHHAKPGDAQDASAAAPDAQNATATPAADPTQSASVESSTLRNAREAYELLMSFGNSGTT